MISNSFHFHFLASSHPATLFDFSHRRFAVFNGDKIYDFIVIFSMKVNCFPSTSNHLLSSSLLRWINLNVILGRAALYRCPIRAILPHSISFFFFALCFDVFDAIECKYHQSMLREDAGERKQLFVLWNLKHFDIIYDRLLERNSTLWPRMWSGRGKDLENFSYITIHSNVSNC
jgi:hypothetical protein